MEHWEEVARQLQSISMLFKQQQGFGHATVIDKSEQLIRQQAREIAELQACLKWYIDTDETGENPDNAFWLEGKKRAINALAKIERV